MLVKHLQLFSGGLLQHFVNLFAAFRSRSDTAVWVAWALNVEQYVFLQGSFKNTIVKNMVWWKIYLCHSYWLVVYALNRLIPAFKVHLLQGVSSSSRSDFVEHLAASCLGSFVFCCCSCTELVIKHKGGHSVLQRTVKSKSVRVCRCVCVCPA